MKGAALPHCVTLGEPPLISEPYAGSKWSRASFETSNQTGYCSPHSFHSLVFYMAPGPWSLAPYLCRGLKSPAFFLDPDWG